MPDYQLLGHTEGPDDDMFGNKSCSMAKTNYASRLEVQKKTLKDKLNGPVAAAHENVNPNLPAVAIRKYGSETSFKKAPMSAKSGGSGIKPPSILSHLS